MQNIQVGPRPYFLVEDMDPGPLKTTLKQCSEMPLRKTDFSIGHRGAALQFPEHTKQSYEAAALMGAEIVECDVTFTKDKQLVCRHSQCDLHTTPNILATPLSQKNILRKRQCLRNVNQKDLAFLSLSNIISFSIVFALFTVEIVVIGDSDGISVEQCNPFNFLGHVLQRA